MKKVIVLALIFLILIPFFTQASSNRSDEEILFYILDSLNGEFLKEDISASEKILDSFLSFSDLEKIGQDVLITLGMIGEERKVSSLGLEEGYYIREVKEDEGYRQVGYFGYDSNNFPLTVILSSYTNIDETGETHLYINNIKDSLLLNKKEIFDESRDIINKVKSIFLKFNKNVNITTCLIGEISGKFSEEEINKAKDSIVNLNGKIVDEYKDENLISLTGFTDYIDYNILAGEDRINLNVALRYYEYDNKTIVWIGTPIITSGY